MEFAVNLRVSVAAEVMDTLMEVANALLQINNAATIWETLFARSLKCAA